jgi:hypothetical protein
MQQSEIIGNPDITNGYHSIHLDYNLLGSGENDMRIFIMHQLALPLIGIFMFIGSFYLYKDIRKVKNWQQPNPIPPTEASKADLVDAILLPGVRLPNEGTGNLILGLGHIIGHIFHGR